MKSVNSAKRQIFKNGGTPEPEEILLWAMTGARIDLPFIEQEDLSLKQ
jgi:hypothetical protein